MALITSGPHASAAVPAAVGVVELLLASVVWPIAPIRERELNVGLEHQVVSACGSARVLTHDLGEIEERAPCGLPEIRPRKLPVPGREDGGCASLASLASEVQGHP
jgi:hypothetical protein